jgi:hypothetical protein
MPKAKHDVARTREQAEELGGLAIPATTSSAFVRPKPGGEVLSIYQMPLLGIDRHREIQVARKFSCHRGVDRAARTRREDTTWLTECASNPTSAGSTY